MGNSHETMIESLDMSLILTRLNDLARRLEGQATSPWMTTVEAAQYLRCSPRKIEDITHKGLLPFSRQDPTSSRSSRRYHRNHLDAYLLTGKNPVAQRLSPGEKRLVEELH